MVLKIISTDQNMFIVSDKVSNIASIDVILMFLLNIYTRYMIWKVKSSRTEGFYKKAVFKNLKFKWLQLDSKPEPLS